MPNCFDSEELAYVFRTDDAALRSWRNGLFLNNFIEGGCDNGWVAIVPDGSVETTPTENRRAECNETQSVQGADCQGQSTTRRP